ncbi:uncharacterized protein LOC118441670 isoform X1 [Vespa mandarinia]|uniref:uncharacterized protein LOC118441670 isoform X1 n=2 Tax=Vespa mandarinia TaxID=7446 RepID=UPI0016114582|nr:uncharacterized protein LOC118441670 isoform X1 [Vespa mandarinia]
MSTRKRMSSYRLWGSTEDGVIEFESMTEDTLSGALDVIRKSLFIHESVCKGVELMTEPGAAEELIELCLNAAKDGVSIVAIDVESGEVVGALFNKIQVAGCPTDKSVFELFSENCKYKSSKALVDFMIDVDSRVNLFKHYNTKYILELMFLATLPNYGKRRIGELLISSTLEMARELKRGKSVKIPVTINNNNCIKNNDIIPTLVSSILTSNYSKKICMKLGFETLLERNFDQYEFNGKKFNDRIDEEHWTFFLVAKRIL